jgi:hypothetical protein
VLLPVTVEVVVVVPVTVLLGLVVAVLGLVVLGFVVFDPVVAGSDESPPHAPTKPNTTLDAHNE